MAFSLIDTKTKNYFKPIAEIPISLINFKFVLHNIFLPPTVVPILIHATRVLNVQYFCRTCTVSQYMRNLH